MANYDIETRDLLLYEKEEWRKTGNSELYEKLVALIQPIIAESDNPIPIKDRGFAFKSLIDDIKANKIGRINLFVYPLSGDCFSYDQNEHIVYLKNIDEPHFAFLFALKLRQYRNNLIGLAPFLSYQIKSNYEDDIKEFKCLLIRIFKVYKLLLDPTIEEMIDFWADNYSSRQTIVPDTLLISNNEPNTYSNNNASLLNEDGSKTKNNSSIAEFLEESRASMGETEDDSIMPNDFFSLKGKWSDTEVQWFFAFLYEEKDRDGETYLSKEATETIFKYGIAIPPEDKIVNRYKLNLGGEKSKKIIDYSIYLFFKNYSHNKTQKRTILKFFASYLEDFAFALDGEKAMEKLSKNVTGEMPSKKFFNLEKHIPPRLADTFKF